MKQPIWIIIAACFAACTAAKLDRSYLPPESAKTAGGTSEILQTPFRAAKDNLPPGSYVNDFDGVVIDVDGAGARATHSGLGASRESYGSTHSKVGEAAFRDTSALNSNNDAQTFTQAPNVAGKPVVQSGQISNAANNLPNFGGQISSSLNTFSNNAGASIPQVQEGQVTNFFNTIPNVAGIRQPVIQGGEDPNRMPVLEQERFHAARDRASNIITYQNDIGIKDFNYSYQTDNGISAGEAGIAVDGVRSQGGYSYTGDDGQVYTVSYTADEGGYRPQGAHLPTPPPIPVEILKALEQNAKDEAAGIVDDGSYDAKKYNTEDTKGNSANDYNDRQHNMFEKGPSFNGVIATINQNSQASKPNKRYQDITVTSQSNGLQSNQFETKLNNFDFTVNNKQISKLSNTNDQNRYDSSSTNFKSLVKQFQSPLSNNQKEDSQNTKQYSEDDVNKQSLNTPLSQQKLEVEKESQDSLSGRPSSYDAPISGPIQGQPINNVENRYPNQFQNKVSSYEQSQQAVVPAVNSALFLNKSPQLVSEVNNNAQTVLLSQPASLSPANFESFGYQPIQQFGVVTQPISSTNIHNQYHKNTEDNENKIRYTSVSLQQNNDRFLTDGIFLHKQFSLKKQQQINEQALSTVINNYGHTANNIPNEVPKDIQYFSTTTTSKPSNQFSYQYNNIANSDQDLTAIPLPFSLSSTFLSSSSQLGQSGQVSQQTFSSTSNDAKLPVLVPSRLLSTPKEDKPEIIPSNGITQASISPFPSIMPIVSSLNNSPRPFDTFSQQTANSPAKTEIISSEASNAANPAQNLNIQNQGEVYEYQKPSPSISEANDKITNQQSTEITQSPQKQNTFFNQQNQQVTSLGTNQSEYVEQSNFESSQANFGPKLLPSRPKIPTNSCCTYRKPTYSSNNNQQNQEQNNFGSSAVTSQNSKNNPQSDTMSDNFKETQTQQAFDETGYHY